MSSTTILSVIQHYQRSIEHSQDDEGRLMHCINKLYKLPVKVEHLQETGVGKTVNSLRKYNGEIGVAAKALVTKWKAMVAAEEEPGETETNNGQNNQNGDDDNDDDDEGDKKDALNGNGQGLCENGDHVNDTDTNRNHKKDSSKGHDKNTKSENTTKERQSKHHHDAKQGSSEHKSKSHRGEKSSKNSHKHHESTKHGREREHDENGVSCEKKIKLDEQNSENRKNENHRHKSSSHDKIERNDRKHSSHKEAKNNSSAEKSNHHRGESKEKRENHQRDEKRNEQTGSSIKHQSNNNISDRESDNNRSPKGKEDKERTKERKHDKNKTSSKDASTHHDKHHKSSTSHASSKYSPTEQPSSSTSASANTKPDNSSSKRKRHQDSDSNEASPTKSKAAKTAKPKAPTNDSGNEIDADNGIDSSMGANFADVLGMLNMPTKKTKKPPNVNKSPTVSAPARNTTIEKPSGSSSSSSNATKDNRKPIDAKPELLSSSAKLAPLDPGLVLELPTISTNYKPLPHNKTVMECVYPNSLAVNNTPKPAVRTLTDAEAISHGISSKTMRTKIYSGVKTGQILQVPSLFDLCIRILQKNIDALEFTGGVPFEVLRPVLERATPLQLKNFEDWNPYLMEDSDCLWQIHVQRSFRSHKREEMESWREMFMRCEEEKELKLNSLTETIKKSQKIIAAPLRKTQLAFVDSMVKPPRNVLRKQAQFGTKEKLVATPAARVAALSNVAPNAVKLGDTRLRTAPTMRDTAQATAPPLRSKKAPLMAKTLQFIRGRHKR